MTLLGKPFTNEELLKIHDKLDEIWYGLGSIKTDFAERDDDKSILVHLIQTNVEFLNNLVIDEITHNE